MTSCESACQVVLLLDVIESLSFVFVKGAECFIFYWKKLPSIISGHE